MNKYEAAQNEKGLLVKKITALQEENEKLKIQAKSRTEQMAYTFQVGNDAAADNLKLTEANKELLAALDMVTRIFIYSSKKEFETSIKIKATELAVHVLLKNGVQTIGQTFETTLNK